MQNFETEPDFINDKGVKYWHNDEGSRYSISKGFKNYISWFIEVTPNHRSIVLMDNTTNKLLKACSSPEELKEYIDSLYILKNVINTSTTLA